MCLLAIKASGTSSIMSDLCRRIHESGNPEAMQMAMLGS